MKRCFISCLVLSARRSVSVLEVLLSTKTALKISAHLSFQLALGFLFLDLIANGSQLCLFLS